MKNRRFIKAFLVASVSISMVACSEEEQPSPGGLGYEIPTTYNFSNVNYSGQTVRLGMMEELGAEMKKGNTVGQQVNAELLKNMFSNTNNPFQNAEYNTSGKQIKDKTFEFERTKLEAYMDSIALYSNAMQEASEGFAGVLTSNDGAKKYLVDAKGVEYAQRIDKGLYGSLIYYQITSVYLSEDKMNVDNITVTENGTAMEHHWDEAFGYFAVPVDFPANTSTAKFWAKYATARDPLLGCNQKLMNAFLKGRAAISNKDMVTRDAQITIIRSELERVIAATALSYMNQAKANFSDNALRCHALSEGTAFINALKFNSERIMQTSEIDAVLAIIGDNFYEVTIDKIESAKSALSTAYGMDDIKNTL